MKGLEEIDCNEDLWSQCTSDLKNGWNIENESRFAFQTKNTRISEDDINSEFWDKYSTADQIDVDRVYPDDKESYTMYFGVSMIIYTSGI